MEGDNKTRRADDQIGNNTKKQKTNTTPSWITNTPKGTQQKRANERFNNELQQRLGLTPIQEKIIDLKRKNNNQKKRKELDDELDLIEDEHGSKEEEEEEEEDTANDTFEESTARVITGNPAGHPVKVGVWTQDGEGYPLDTNGNQVTDVDLLRRSNWMQETKTINDAVFKRWRKRRDTPICRQLKKYHEMYALPDDEELIKYYIFRPKKELKDYNRVWAQWQHFEKEETYEYVWEMAGVRNETIVYKDVTTIVRPPDAGIICALKEWEKIYQDESKKGLDTSTGRGRFLCYWRRLRALTFVLNEWLVKVNNLGKIAVRVLVTNRQTEDTRFAWRLYDAEDVRKMLSDYKFAVPNSDGIKAFSEYKIDSDGGNPKLPDISFSFKPLTKQQKEMGESATLDTVKVSYTFKSAFDIWLSSHWKARVDDVVMDPSPEPTYDKSIHLNLWGGLRWSSELVSEYNDFKYIVPVLQHLRMCITHTQEEYDWLITAMASRVQAPHIKLEKLVMFLGDQGIGKTMWLEILHRIYGPAHSVLIQSAEDVVGDFTDAINSKILVCIDEGRVHPNMIETINNLVTSHHERSRGMYCPPQYSEGQNYKSVFWAANQLILNTHEKKVINKDTRRFVLFNPCIDPIIRLGVMKNFVATFTPEGTLKRMSPAEIKNAYFKGLHSLLYSPCSVGINGRVENMYGFKTLVNYLFRVDIGRNETELQDTLMTHLKTPLFQINLWTGLSMESRFVLYMIRQGVNESGQTSWMKSVRVTNLIEDFHSTVNDDEDQSKKKKKQGIKLGMDHNEFVVRLSETFSNPSLILSRMASQQVMMVDFADLETMRDQVKIDYPGLIDWIGCSLKDLVSHAVESICYSRTNHLMMPRPSRMPVELDGNGELHFAVASYDPKKYSVPDTRLLCNLNEKISEGSRQRVSELHEHCMEDNDLFVQTLPKQTQLELNNFFGVPVHQDLLLATNNNDNTDPKGNDEELNRAQTIEKEAALQYCASCEVSKIILHNDGSWNNSSYFIKAKCKDKHCGDFISIVSDPKGAIVKVCLFSAMHNENWAREMLMARGYDI